MHARFRAWYALMKIKHQQGLDGLSDETLEKLALVLGDIWEKENKTFLEVLREGRQWGVLEELET